MKNFFWRFFSDEKLSFYEIKSFWKSPWENSFLLIQILKIYENILLKIVFLKNNQLKFKLFIQIDQ